MASAIAGWPARLMTVAGFVLLLPVGFFYAASGLVVPAAFIPVMWLIWLAFVAFAIWQRRRPGFVLATPLVAALTGLLIVSAGGALFDWTA